jgi:predicted neuraminidase
MCHASTVLELENGDLLCAWYGGSSESSSDTKIYLSRKPAGGQWTSPEMIADGHGEPVWNPVLFQPRGGDIMCFYKCPNINTGEVVTSSDNGLTWSSWQPVGDGLTGPVVNKPVQLDDGTIISGSSRQDPERVHVEISSDNGQTWTHSGDLSDFDQYPVIQPTILVHSQTELQLIVRRSYADSKDDKLGTTWSHDAGRTWEPLTLTSLPANDCAQDALSLRCGDGRHLLFYNHSTRADSDTGGKGRGILNMAVTTDGINFDAALVLDYRNDGSRYTYPAAIQTQDGLVHVTYTFHRKRIKHMVLNPYSSALQTFPIPDSGEWPKDKIPWVESSE